MASQVSHAQGREPRAQGRRPGQGDRPVYWGLELEGGPVERVAPDCYHCLLLEGLRSPPHLRGFRIRDRRITILGENLVTWLLNTRLTREVMRS